MITISLCMIVKNEEETLARCLDSIADLMDEIIIVDTGSSDRTKEIAARYTNLIYDFTWTGNFSDARNYSFSKAGMDYIYCADADEILDEANHAKFLELKKCLLTEIEIVQMYYCNQLEFGTIYNFDREYRPKLYKRVRSFVWADPIHEMVILEPRVYDSEIEIIHQPKGEHSSRDLAYFHRITSSGEPISLRLQQIYAKELYISGTQEDFLNALPYFETVCRKETSTADDIKAASCIVAKAARLAQDTDLFLKYTLKSVALEGCAEICYELGEYFAARGDFDEAAIWFYNAAYETECILNVRYGKEYPLQRLAECYEELGNKEQAEHYRKEVARVLEETR